ncbi:hypothetical protein GUITHDRAFT_110897 [Guillardia theta CCMP2712]|uniref:Uncharacterized protein n=1 Tax=Guillardia theta (strain CCMP2712) TaxID=905079 RepID=L1J506_GUITC|nr:hypothetical protein GUITHDRAFT_110897 [Guillardia theta CCMP2712]EKX43170.1 hypothetical protein GUITHDRAFT_110897 [Guillardia theta CCMP2712]|eukprot:XP_005830150.1 hypothetical protein GUITHDRAFT_110897 [Guillardia theta CCMP2712]
MYGETGNFFTAIQRLANKVEMHSILSSLRRYLIIVLDGENTMESSGVRASQLFSAMNPIDKLMETEMEFTASTHLCMIEACSGSGKSLCAADFFVRHPEECIYFLFRPSNPDMVRLMYSYVESITDLMALAINTDLRLLVQSAPPTSSIESVSLSALDVTDFRQTWYILGALGYLWNETTTVAPVSVQKARTWERRLVLMDETIPDEQDYTAIAKLMLVKRVLTTAGIHCIMLGTNSAAMNMDRISKPVYEHSRHEGRMMVCLTHRSLPRYLLSSNQDKEAMTRVFAEARLDELLDNVNPWLCSLFLKYLKKEGDTVPCSLMRTVSSKVLEEVKRIKRNLMDESIYCMFQISAHSPVSQLHISKGFAQLNVRQSKPPLRGSSESMLVLTQEQDDEEMRIKGTRLPDLNSCFPSALRDPITVAVCAGGGLPFSRRSALEVLQGIHKQKAVWSNPINVDAYKSGGDELKSFGAVVMMISSWSPPQDLLKNIAFHCGIQNDKRSVDEILASLANKASFVEILKTCMSNLAPVLSDEQESAASPFMGFYIRNRDRKGRDDAFTGPTCASDKPLEGGVEFKNWKTPLSRKQFSKAISRLLSKDLDVYVFMVLELSETITESVIQQYISHRKASYKTEWLVLHLNREGWSTFSIQNDASGTRSVSKIGKGIHEQAEVGAVKRKVLMIVEVGIDTQPFCSNE